jgi:prepilin-type N-terminal cleavage/methylation domain-containing protein
MLVPLRSRRGGFTLIELLVVISILAILATLTALFFPSFNNSRKVASGADQLSGWLLISKQRARRDGVPTGLRFYVGKTAPSGQPAGTQFCNTLVYIQQPDDVSVGYYAGNSGNNTVQITLPPGVSLLSGSYLVQANDYLELDGGSQLRRITGVTEAAITLSNGTKTNQATLSLNAATAPLPGPLQLPSGGDANAVSSPASRNYRIIRQAQVISGEQQLTLPDIVVVDFTINKPMNANRRLSLNVPPSLAKDPTNTNDYYDILFAPSGAVVSPGASTNHIYLFVRSAGPQNQPLINTNDLLVGDATLIVVDPRTGFIANHPVASTVGDPYLFTRDGRSSGM